MRHNAGLYIGLMMFIGLAIISISASMADSQNDQNGAINSTESCQICNESMTSVPSAAQSFGINELSKKRCYTCYKRVCCAAARGKCVRYCNRAFTCCS